MARLSDFSLDDSSPTTSPHAHDSDAHDNEALVPDQQGRDPEQVEQPDGSTGALLVAPIDPSTLTGTPAERLAALEEAMDRADEAAAQGMRRVKARHIVEVGTALRAVQAMKEDLPEVLGLTWTQFVTERRGMQMSRAHQYMEAAPALLRVWTSKILEVPPNESQATVLDAIIEQHGEDAARETADQAIAETGKATAGALTATARRLGYADPTERKSTPKPPKSPLVALKEAVKQAQVAYNAVAPKAAEKARAEDAEEAERLLRELGKVAGKVVTRTQAAQKAQKTE